MDRDADRLLHDLREAIEEALAQSLSVAEAMAALERKGHCPSFLVDVGLTKKPELEPGEASHAPDAAAAAAWDEQFLRAIGITSGI